MTFSCSLGIFNCACDFFFTRERFHTSCQQTMELCYEGTAGDASYSSRVPRSVYHSERCLGGGGRHSGVLDASAHPPGASVQRSNL